MPLPANDRPFVLELLRVDETPDGNFRPGAFVAFTPALRTSGLLLALSGEDLKSLLLVLTFAHPNGHVQPSLLELAQALRQPQGQTRTQMRRLERFLWLGKPLLHELRRDNGLHAWTPSPRILGIQYTPQTASQGSAPVPVAAGREAILAHSRATYARPREEVEQEIARANGWEWPFRTQAERQDALRQQAQDANSSHPQAQTREPSSDAVTSRPMNAFPNAPTSPDDALRTELRRDLATWGVPADLIERLLADYAPDKIRNQLDWLPLRNANDPARFLVAAIQKDYAAPPSVRRRQTLEQAMQDAATAAQPSDSVENAETTDLPLP